MSAGAPQPPDPYRTLGVTPAASEPELRAAYRRLVQLHHPDHNGGSPESARRFEEVQAAYAQIRTGRRASPADTGAGATSTGAGATSTGPDDLDARLAALERELQAARQQRDRAARETRLAQERTLRDLRREFEDDRGRASDEELGYYSTDDSFSAILDDALGDLSGRMGQARRTGAADRAADLLEDLAGKLRGEPHKPQ